MLGGGFAVQGGKDGAFRLLQFGRTRGATPRRGGEAQVLSTPSSSGLYSAPSVLHVGTTTWIFVADNSATAALTLSGGRLRQMWRNGTGGTSPVVAGGLLYVFSPGGGLHVYQSETGQQVAELEVGSGHWNSPIVVDGRIALPEGNANRHSTTGVLNIWRLP